MPPAASPVVQVPVASPIPAPGAPGAPLPAAFAGSMLPNKATILPSPSQFNYPPPGYVGGPGGCPGGAYAVPVFGGLAQQTPPCQTTEASQTNVHHHHHHNDKSLSQSNAQAESEGPGIHLHFEPQ